MTNNNPAYRPIFWFSCAVLFLYFAISLTAIGSSMFGDTDPLWHVATGDLIRNIHALPKHDPWSFTAGDYLWMNISWIWDIGLSYIHEQLGWHGAAAVNGIVVALIIVIIYATCILRSGHFAASIISTIGSLTLLSILLRPLQFSNLMVAVWMLLLGSIARGQIKPCWLFALPILMLLWVNIHGGFIVGGILLVAFFLQAVHDRKYDLARALFMAGITTMLAMLCNPYSIYIIDGALRSMTSAAAQFIHEWQPFTASPHNLLTYFYAVAFILLVPRRKLPILAAERWLAYMWLLLALISNRNLTLFAIIAAPIIACSLQQYLVRYTIIPKKLTATISEAVLFFYNRRPIAIAAILTCLYVAVWLPTPMAAQVYSQQNVDIPHLDPEIDFIKKHIPKARLLTHFDLGGTILYQTRGSILVFIDGRCETAYPTEVVKDYVKFLNAAPGWESVIDRYSLNGVMIPNKDYDELYDRFRHRNGWKLAFKGPTATIFMRTSTNN